MKEPLSEIRPKIYLRLSEEEREKGKGKRNLDDFIIDTFMCVTC